jgi:hypothetical protein
VAKAGAHYSWWYPTRYVGWSRKPSYDQFGKLASHMAYVDRTSRRLARSIFHAMMRYQAKLEKKQRTLARIVDIGTELFAMAATISYATMLSKKKETANAPELAALFCHEARERIEQAFDTLFDNHDSYSYKTVQKFLKGNYDWLQGQLVQSDVAMPTPEAVDRAVQELAKS